MLNPPPAESHSIALFFHWCFKVAAILWYIFCTWFSSNFVVNFVVAVVLTALDFWTVKNVTGRKLVALRWWNEASDTGSTWRFEAAPEGSRVVLAREKNLFWLGLVVNCVAWGVLAFFALVGFQLDYIIIPIVGCILGGSNLVGYFKCSKEAGEQLKTMTSSIMQQAATQAVTHAVTNTASRV